MIQIGIDVGGTKMEAAALDAQGAVLIRERLPNPGNYAQLIADIRALVDGIEQRVGTAASVGIGTPGTIDPRSGLLRNSNATFLNDRMVEVDLAAALGRPVRIANDANCLALSESLDGAGAGFKVTFAVIVGTGVGGGLVVDGSIVVGAHGMGGEWGHTPLPWMHADEFPGPACWCGQPGCLDIMVSGTGIRQDHERQTGSILQAPAIIAAAERGDAAARQTLDRYVDRLGRALAMVVNIVDPDIFVLGGGMSNVSMLYEALPAVIRRYAFGGQWNGRIAPARWGDSSGVRGAARLWPLPAQMSVIPAQTEPAR